MVGNVLSNLLLCFLFLSQSSLLALILVLLAVNIHIYEKQSASPNSAVFLFDYILVEFKSLSLFIYS